MTQQLSFPTHCPFCNSDWKIDDIKETYEQECSGCSTEHKTTLFVASGEDWDWQLNIWIDNNVCCYYSDQVFYLNTERQDFFPPFDIKKLLTLINFS